jgi:hypothetical protein
MLWANKNQAMVASRRLNHRLKCRSHDLCPFVFARLPLVVFLPRYPGALGTVPSYVKTRDENDRICNRRSAYQCPRSGKFPSLLWQQRMLNAACYLRDTSSPSPVVTRVGGNLERLIIQLHTDDTYVRQKNCRSATKPLILRLSFRR